MLTDTRSGSIIQIASYAIDSPAPPFPVLTLAFVLNGFGLALQVRTKPYMNFTVVIYQYPACWNNWLCRQFEGSCSDQDGNSPRLLRQVHIH